MMCSKFDHPPKGQEALKKAEEDVIQFVNKYRNDGDLSHVGVGKERAIIRSCRMVLEDCPGNLSWEKKPPYWPEHLSFADPNNQKKNKSDLTEIVKFLVCQVKKYLGIEVKNQEFESSLATSSRQCHDLVKKGQDWDVNDQFKRISDRLLCPFLILDSQLKDKLLAIIETYLRSEPLAKAYELEFLIDQVKMSQKNPQQAEPFRRQLQTFADAYSLPSSSSASAPDCEGELQKGANDSVECAAKDLDENQNRMPVTDCDTNKEWQPTLESAQDESRLMMELDLITMELDLIEEEVQNISSNSVECVDHKDGESDCVCCNVSMETVVEGTNEEQTLGPGSQVENDACASAKKLLEEVIESHVKEVQGPSDVSETRKAIENDLEEEFKAFVKMSYGVKVREENVDMLSPETINAILSYMERDYSDVLVFPTLDHKRRRNYGKTACRKLVKTESKRWLLFPVLHDKHWLLLAADSEENNFYILDSLPNEQLASELTSWFKALMLQYTGNRSGEWEKIELACGMQKNDNSCGYFLLMNAEAFVNRLRLKFALDLFRHCHIPLFREWIDGKMKNFDSSKSIFHYFDLQVSPEESMCHICQEMHREVLFGVNEPNVT